MNKTNNKATDSQSNTTTAYKPEQTHSKEPKHDDVMIPTRDKDVEEKPSDSSITHKKDGVPEAKDNVRD